METITLDQALDAVMQLPPQQQAMLIDIVRHRHIEARRQEIAKGARQSITAFRKGMLNPQPIQAIITELRESLDETTE